MTANDFNVVLISIDTLRPDHLGCYGYHRDTSPNIDRLASEGVRFANYVANAGWTLPQHFTLLTGMYPATHNVIRLHSRPLSPRLTLLAQLLQQHGYRTQGILSQNKFLAPRYGFNRGFDHLQWGPGRNRHTPAQTEQVIHYLRTQQGNAGRFFLFIHNDDCHEPFDPPAEFNPFGDAYMDKYDGEIRFVDHYVGQWIAALRETGLAERTVVFLTSDHGTEFRHEHGFDGKMASLYNAVVRCLLIVWGPGAIPAGRVVSGLTETAQVTPTILDLLGLPPKADAQGQSFAHLLFDGDAAGLPYVCSYTLRDGNVRLTAYEQDAICTQREKLVRVRLKAPFNPIFFHRNWLERLRGRVQRLGLDPRILRPGGVIREFYDLNADPLETHSLYEQNRPDSSGELERRLDDWLARTKAAYREWLRVPVRSSALRRNYELGGRR